MPHGPGPLIGDSGAVAPGGSSAVSRPRVAVESSLPVEGVRWRCLRVYLSQALSYSPKKLKIEAQLEAETVTQLRATAKRT
jgi:hypothetical protein